MKGEEFEGITKELSESCFDYVVLLKDTKKNEIEVGTAEPIDDMTSEPYIMIRKWSDDKLIGICRLSILEPRYITGYNENMTLSDKEKEEFISCLESDAYYYTDADFNKDIKSKWDYILDSFDQYRSFVDLEPEYLKNKEKYKIPDYKNLH